MALKVHLLEEGKLYTFYQVTLTTLTEAENFKLGIIFLWSMEETLCV